jgi:methionyl-tRNA formyltransferase
MLARMVRAYNPWPVAFAEIEGIQCRVFRAAAVVEDSGPPGHLVREPGLRDRVRVACGAGALDIFELQAPGRKRVSARDWLNAHPDWMRP